MHTFIYGFEQSKVLEYGLNIFDIIILYILCTEIKQGNYREIFVKDGKNYYLIYSANILHNYPILNITKRRYQQILSVLEQKGVVKRYYNKSKKPFIRVEVALLNSTIEGNMDYVADFKKDKFAKILKEQGIDKSVTVRTRNQFGQDDPINKDLVKEKLQTIQNQKDGLFDFNEEPTVIVYDKNDIRVKTEFYPKNFIIKIEYHSNTGRILTDLDNFTYRLSRDLIYDDEDDRYDLDIYKRYQTKCTPNEIIIYSLGTNKLKIKYSNQFIKTVHSIIETNLNNYRFSKKVE